MTNARLKEMETRLHQAMRDVLARELVDTIRELQPVAKAEASFRMDDREAHADFMCTRLEDGQTWEAAMTDENDGTIQFFGSPREIGECVAIVLETKCKLRS